MEDKSRKKIKIVKDGPYLVYGDIPLEEKLITENGDRVQFKQGKTYPAMESYSLCRCGRSSNMPFCDGQHLKTHFNGKETASREPFFDQADMLDGPDLILADVEDLCAFARFCHGEHGDSWSLTMHSDNSRLKAEALQTICNCPAGRLVAIDKQTNEPIEPHYEPSIVIIQDKARHCSGPIWVRGGVPIESSDGSVYEIRNRVTLCRCGRSENKPFCDAMHISIGFSDKK